MSGEMKNPEPVNGRGQEPSLALLDLFSGMFNVARNPVNKSPR